MKKTTIQFVRVMIVITVILVNYHSAFASPLKSPSMASTTYYVSPSGNDLNSCISSAPCNTFDKVMSLVVSGDTIVAEAGTYNQSLVISKSGITVRGNNAVINTTATHGIQVSATTQNVAVRGFTVTGTLSHAIYVEGQFVTIEGNTVYHSILANGSVSGGVITCGNSAWGSAIKLGLGSSDVTVRGNTVYENCGEGIAVTRGSNAVIELNTVYDNKAVNIYVDNSFNIQVLNNNSYCTNPTINIKGIALGEEFYSGWGAQLRDITISGNTITNCYTGVSAFESNVGGTLTNVTISNNYIPTGQNRGISIDTPANSNVLISNNTHFNTIWVRNPVGVTLLNNIKVSGTPTIMPTTSSTPSYTPTATPTNTPSSTPTPTVTSTPQTEVFYDDKNAAFVYSSGWTNETRAKAYGGSFKITSVNASFVTMNFTGQSFSILYTSGPNFRKIDVYIDNVLVGSIDQKASVRSYQQRWNYQGNLISGSHTLKLVFVSNVANTKGSFDAVIIR